MISLETKAMSDKKLKEQRTYFVFNTIYFFRQLGIKVNELIIHRALYFMKELAFQDIPYEFTYRQDKYGIYSQDLDNDLQKYLAYKLLDYEYEQGSKYAPMIKMSETAERRYVFKNYIKKKNIIFVGQLFLRDTPVNLQRITLMLYLYKKNIKIIQKGVNVDIDTMRKQFLKYKPGSQSDFKPTLDTLKQWQQVYNSLDEYKPKDNIKYNEVFNIISEYGKAWQKYERVQDFVEKRFLQKNLLNTNHCYCDGVNQITQDGISFYVYQSCGGYQHCIGFQEGYPKKLYD